MFINTEKTITLLCQYVSVNNAAPNKYKKNAVWKSVYAQDQFIDKNIPNLTLSKVQSLRLRFLSTSLFNFSLSFLLFQLKSITLSYISKRLRMVMLDSGLVTL